MSSRALSLATVLLLIGFGAADTAFGQATNLEAGKTPSQLFTQTCNACHKSPRGLLKSVSPGSLPGFLRQHYTTSSDMAGVLASYLISNGATDTRYGGGQPKGEKDGKGGKEKEANSGATQEHPGRRTHPSQEAAKPEGEGAPPSEAGQAGRKRMARPAEEGAKDAASEQGRKGKQRLGKRGKPETEEGPKAEPAREAGTTPPADEKGETKNETAKVDSGRDEAKSSGDKSSGDKSSGDKSVPGGEKPSAESKQDAAAKSKPETGTSQSAKAEPGSDTPALRPDPVPPVTPAPPATPKPAEQAATGAGSSEPAAARPVEKPQDKSQDKPQDAPPASTTAAAVPPPPPVAPAGPPAPPISQ